MGRSRFCRALSVSAGAGERRAVAGRDGTDGARQPAGAAVTQLTSQPAGCTGLSDRSALPVPCLPACPRRPPPPPHSGGNCRVRRLASVGVRPTTPTDRRRPPGHYQYRAGRFGVAAVAERRSGRLRATTATRSDRRPVTANSSDQSEVSNTTENSGAKWQAGKTVRCCERHAVILEVICSWKSLPPPS